MVGIITYLGGCGDNNPITIGIHHSNNEHKKTTSFDGWYFRTVVTAKLADGRTFDYRSGGIFGRAVDSEDGFDKHDIPVFGTAILQSVFVQTEWNEKNGDFFSDYRSLPKNDPYRDAVWDFQIKNQQSVNLANATLHISVEGPYGFVYTSNGIHEFNLTEAASLKYDLFLVDIDKQTVHPYMQLGASGLTMESMHTRSFRWVLGNVRNRDLVPFVTTEVTAASSRMTAPLRIDASPSKFGLPPEL